MSLQVLLNGVISKYMQICYVFFDEFLGIDSRNFFDVQRFLTSMFVRFERPSTEVVLIYRCACCCCRAWASLGCALPTHARHRACVRVNTEKAEKVAPLFWRLIVELTNSTCRGNEVKTRQILSPLSCCTQEQEVGGNTFPQRSPLSAGDQVLGLLIRPQEAGEPRSFGPGL